MTLFECEFLGSKVELTAERERHVRRRHENVTRDDVSHTLANPDLVVRRAWIPDETLLIREVDAPTGARHIVVVVVRDDPATATGPARFWVATAYRAAAPPIGFVIWQRS
jgi:hypothetical protein